MTVALLSKMPAGTPGNFNYVYSCTCSDGSMKAHVELTSANDNEATMLAEMQCGENCGESVRSLIISTTTAETTSGRKTSTLSVVTPLVLTKRVRMYSIGQVVKIGLRNTCEECTVAVIVFIYVGGRHEIKKLRMEGKSDVILDIDGTERVEIIDEEKC